MDFFEALILGVVQGISEFLPVSSSGHLIIVEKLMGLKIEELKSFDVALHIATLTAIILYFWRDIVGMINAVWKFLGRKLDKNDPHGKLIPLLLLGTIPAVAVGFFAGDYLDEKFRNVESVGSLLVGVGIFFLVAEWVNKRVKRREEMGMGSALIVGIAQAMALIPGVSRSGSTIATGLFLGFERSEIARFSFLLGMPAMAGAGILTFMDMSAVELASMDYGVVAVGFVSALLSGVLCISLLMRFLKNHTLAVFAAYRIVLGLTIIYLWA